MSKDQKVECRVECLVHHLRCGCGVRAVRYSARDDLTMLDDLTIKLNYITYLFTQRIFASSLQLTLRTTGHSGSTVCIDPVVESMGNQVLHTTSFYATPSA